MFTLYGAITNGEFNEGLDRQAALRLEDQAGSHITHLAVFKDAIGRALDLPGLDLDGFTTVMEHFVNQLENWKHLLANYRPDVWKAESGGPWGGLEDSGSPVQFDHRFMRV